MASHELKTPMTTILGQVQLMLRRLSKMPELSYELATMRNALESINAQTRRLNALVDDLLDVYNVHTGKVQLRLEACNLVDICREVVEEQRLLTGRTIELEAPLTPVILQADNDRLEQVVINLVSNALKYSPESSPVKVLVEQRRDIGSIEVYDSGPGIPKNEQSHIFEPFYRGSDVQTTVKSGLGLGLTICKDIVERHSGRIWCRSRVGKGSIFIVELPLGKSMARKVR
jgi:signal transduction histidine kinase